MPVVLSLYDFFRHVSTLFLKAADLELLADVQRFNLRNYPKATLCRFDK